MPDRADTLRIAIPSKGRLSEPAFALFHDAGIRIHPNGRSLRLYAAEHGIEVLLARADDIPVWTEDRAVDLGIAGSNQIRESGADVEVLMPLGFGRCRLALAAPADAGFTSLADLAGRRIATSYTRTVSARLAEAGIQATLIPISGSVELAPSLDAAEAVVDLVSSGETLRQNGLVEVETILESEAVLLAARGLEPGLAERVSALRTVLEAVLAARPKRYLMLNAHDDDLASILSLLPGIDAPTILPLARAGMHAVHAVVAVEDVPRLLGPLKRSGATGILALPIEHLIP
jgi:ATP phosphoribosyltransferase